MRTEYQMAEIIARSTKEHQLTLARKFGFPSRVLAEATFGLAVSMMHESGYSEEQITAYVRQLLEELTAAPSDRGAS